MLSFRLPRFKPFTLPKLNFSPLSLRIFNSHLSIVTIYAPWINGDDAFLLKCLSTNQLPQALHLLDKIPQQNSIHNPITHFTSLLSKFAQNGFITEACTLFDIMPARNIVTYNAMLSAYLNSGRLSDAYHLFNNMPERNVVSWTSMLSGFARAGKIGLAKELFDLMPERNVVTWNCMIGGFIENGCLEDGRKMFDQMPQRNVVSWNTMIKGYCESVNMREARALFERMDCANVVTWTSMVAGYCRAGEVEEAYRLFARMPERNVVSWTAMIGGFVWNGLFESALRLFVEMKYDGDVRPNEETFISLVYACSGMGLVRIGKQLHVHLVVNGLEFEDYDGRIFKSLLHMYSQFGVMDVAFYLFMKNAGRCTSESLNSIINGYIRVGQLVKARHVFDVVPFRDIISWTSMITGYFQTGNVTEACLLFNYMPNRDSVSWTAMISGHVQNERFVEAIQIFHDMRVAGSSPLDYTFSSLLGAVGAMAYLELGMQFHSLLSKVQFKSDVTVDNALISMYAKCGAVDDAQQIFASMALRDVVSWNSIIMGLAHHGLANEALKLFKKMKNEGIGPNSVTFLGVLLACSHAGMIDHGWELFSSMTHKYSVAPDVQHYVCMVDLLGRAGKVVEAEEFVNRLPFEPGLAIWGALLGVCSLKNTNIDVAKKAAIHVLELDPTNASAHVLLCNIYAASSQQTDEKILRQAMELKGVRKLPGRSWILLNGRVHGFISGDNLHPECKEILSLLFGD